ncbi:MULTISPECIES: pyridoxal phosphate-dependent aminotransferase [Vagococcus]|uniref:Aminotransferase n=1 Tax=Vagococcus fluvialis bH819 TaxID=1255619 RepID=A0A1X6WPS5_9ENTE|nr:MULTISPECIES: pyridoxal phosphate-dependent aminotransferase [Vagococcus]SLM86314.1 Aspartate aminotransferase [Vagococcus fluvialis bH819]HCM88966.1 pyridoxal phosphate-dependent aminotransferase [Vagococcus sp.]
MDLSDRAANLKPSATLAAAAKAKKLKEQGIDVLSLTLGEPDFSTPKNIQQAAINSIETGQASFYTPVQGTSELITAIIERTKIDYGITYQPNEVIVGTGAKFVLYTLFQTILNQGDEVIIPVPYWVSYAAQVELAEGVPVFVEGNQEAGFKVTVADLEKSVTNKTKAFILNSPCNPTGAIYSKEELEKIGEWAIKHNILIVADDIYGKLVYNGNVFTPIATLSEKLKKQTIVINGVSKSYAMTGWRIGYALGDSQIISQMIKIASQATSNPSAVSQYAATEALIGDQIQVEIMRQIFEERLNHVYKRVSEIPGFKVDKPHGAFYLYPDISECMTTCGYTDVDTWVNDLLEEAHVAVVTGAGFGTKNHIRLSYATDLETLNQAIDQITAFVQSKAKQIKK